MSDFFDKIFKSDKTMMVAQIITILCWIFLIVSIVVSEQVIDSLTFSLLLSTAVFGGVVVWSYKTHDKNIMKPALGMLMGSINMFVFVEFSKNIFSAEGQAAYFESGALGYSSFALDALECLLFLTFAMMHLAMNKTHESSPTIVNWNKFIIAVLLILFIIETILSVPGSEMIDIIEQIVFYIGLTSITLLITSIEVKIDYFRAVRQEKNNK